MYDGDIEMLKWHLSRLANVRSETMDIFFFQKVNQYVRLRFPFHELNFQPISKRELHPLSHIWPNVHIGCMMALNSARNLTQISVTKINFFFADADSYIVHMEDSKKNLESGSH